MKVDKSLKALLGRNWLSIINPYWQELLPSSCNSVSSVVVVTSNALSQSNPVSLMGNL